MNNRHGDIGSPSGYDWKGRSVGTEEDEFFMVAVITMGACCKGLLLGWWREQLRLLFWTYCK